MLRKHKHCYNYLLLLIISLISNNWSLGQYLYQDKYIDHLDQRMIHLCTIDSLEENIIRLSSHSDYNSPTRPDTQHLSLEINKLISDFRLDINTLLTETNDFLSTQKKLSQKITALRKGSNLRNGFIDIHGQYSGNDLPFNNVPASFLRLRSEVGFDLVGVPLLADLYYTTENRLLPGSNYFTINFDLEAYRSQLMTQARSKENLLLDYKKVTHQHKEKLATAQSDLRRKVNALDRRIQAEIDNLKVGVTDTLNSINSHCASCSSDSLKRNHKKALDEHFVSDSIESQIKPFKLKQRTQSTDTLLNLLKAERVTLQRGINTIDSLTDLLFSLTSKFDSIKGYSKKLNEIGKDSLRSRKEKLTSSIQGFLTKLESFQMGMINPYFSLNTLNGIPINGVAMSFYLPDSMYRQEIVLGKTVSQSLRGLSFERDFNNNPPYIIAIRSQIFLRGENDLSFVNLSAIRNRSIQPIHPAISNLGRSVFGIEYRYDGSNLRILSEFVESYGRSGSTLPGSENSSNPNVAVAKSIIESLSFTSQMEYDIRNRLIFDGAMDIKGSEFSSIGAPFQRNNYFNGELGTKAFLLRNLLTARVFRSLFIDNLNGINALNNKSSSTGFFVSSHFKKLPNIIVSYQPVSQSSRTDGLDQLNIMEFDNLSVQISYQFQKKSLVSNYCMSLSRFKNSIQRNLGPIENNNQTVLNIYGYHRQRKLSLSHSFLWRVTSNQLDSGLLAGANIQFAYKFNRFQLNSRSSYRQNVSGGYQFQSSLNISKKNHKHHWTMEAGLNFFRMQEIWGVKRSQFIQSEIRLIKMISKL